MANFDLARQAIKTHITVDNVRLPFHEVPCLVQGAHRHNAKLAHGFDTVDSPMKFAEELRMSARNMRTTSTTQHNNSNREFRAQSQPHTNAIALTVPKSQSIIKPTVDNRDSRDSVFIKQNAFYRQMLSYIDPQTGLFPDDTLARTLHKFKADLAENLTNANQLFKKLGFARRRSASVDDMKANIVNAKGDASLSDDIIEYIAKLSKHNIVIVDFTSNPVPKRDDFCYTSDSATYLLFDRVNYETPVVTFDTATDLVAHLKSHVKERLLPLSRQTLATLKEASKLLGVYKSTASKDAIIEVLTPYIV